MDYRLLLHRWPWKALNVIMTSVCIFLIEWCDFWSSVSASINMQFLFYFSNALFDSKRASTTVTVFFLNLHTAVKYFDGPGEKLIIVPALYCVSIFGKLLRKSFNPVRFNGKHLSKMRCFVQRGLIREHFVRFIRQCLLPEYVTKHDGRTVLSAISRASCIFSWPCHCYVPDHWVSGYSISLCNCTAVEIVCAKLWGGWAPNAEASKIFSYSCSIVLLDECKEYLTVINTIFCSRLSTEHFDICHHKQHLQTVKMSFLAYPLDLCYATHPELSKLYNVTQPSAIT